MDQNRERRAAAAARQRDGTSPFRGGLVTSRQGAPQTIYRGGDESECEIRSLAWLLCALLVSLAVNPPHCDLSDRVPFALASAQHPNGLPSVQPILISSTVVDVAAMVTYLAGESSSAIIGAALRVDGGVVKAIL